MDAVFIVVATLRGEATDMQTSSYVDDAADEIARELLSRLCTEATVLERATRWSDDPPDRFRG